MTNKQNTLTTTHATMTTTTTELLISPFRKEETPLSATASKDERRYAMQHLAARGGNIYATNGCILAVYPDRVNGGDAHKEAVLPREVVQAATKGAQRAAIEVEGDSATSHTRAGSITGSLVNREFPQCNAVIDGLPEAEHDVYLDGDQLIALLKAIGGVKGRVVKLRLPKDGNRPFRVETDDAWGIMMPLRKDK